MAETLEVPTIKITCEYSWIYYDLELDSIVPVFIRSDNGRILGSDNGILKVEGMYDVIGKENGTFKYYDEKGKIEKVEIYLHGVLLARGIFDEKERRQGYWEEYYIGGSIKSKGKYIDGKKIVLSAVSLIWTKK